MREILERNFNLEMLGDRYLNEKLIEIYESKDDYKVLDKKTLNEIRQLEDGYNDGVLEDKVNSFQREFNVMFLELSEELDDVANLDEKMIEAFVKEWTSAFIKKRSELVTYLKKEESITNSDFVNLLVYLMLLSKTVSISTLLLTLRNERDFINRENKDILLSKIIEDIISLEIIKISTNMFTEEFKHTYTNTIDDLLGVLSEDKRITPRQLENYENEVLAGLNLTPIQKKNWKTLDFVDNRYPEIKKEWVEILDLTTEEARLLGLGDKNSLFNLEYLSIDLLDIYGKIIKNYQEMGETLSRRDSILKDNIKEFGEHLQVEIARSKENSLLKLEKDIEELINNISDIDKMKLEILEERHDEVRLLNRVNKEELEELQEKVEYLEERLGDFKPEQSELLGSLGNLLSNKETENIFVVPGLTKEEPEETVEEIREIEDELEGLEELEEAGEEIDLNEIERQKEYFRRLEEEKDSLLEKKAELESKIECTGDLIEQEEEDSPNYFEELEELEEAEEETEEGTEEMETEEKGESVEEFDGRIDLGKINMMDNKDAEEYFKEYLELLSVELEELEDTERIKYFTKHNRLGIAVLIGYDLEIRVKNIQEVFEEAKENRLKPVIVASGSLEERVEKLAHELGIEVVQVKDIYEIEEKEGKLTELEEIILDAIMYL